MAENVENLILAQLREIRAEMAQMRGEIGGFRSETNDGFEATNAKVDGVSVLLSMLAGHVQRLETRIEHLEDIRKGS
jgi:hypothetical protein